MKLDIYILCELNFRKERKMIRKETSIRILSQQNKNLILKLVKIYAKLLTI